MDFPDVIFNFSKSFSVFPSTLCMTGQLWPSRVIWYQDIRVTHCQSSAMSFIVTQYSFCNSFIHILINKLMIYTYTKNNKCLVFIVKIIWLSKPDPFNWRFIQCWSPSWQTRWCSHVGLACWIASCQLKWSTWLCVNFHFLPLFCFAKRTNIYYIPKVAGLNISQYLFWHPCNHLLHSHSLDYYQETKTKTDLPTFFWQEKLIYQITTSGGGGGGGGKNFEVSQ